LSRIIKNSNLVLADPLVIEFFNALVWEEEVIHDQEIEEEVHVLSELEREQEEIEALRGESQKILAETEQLVMDLLEKARNEAKMIIGNAQDEVDLLRTQVAEESEQIRAQAGMEGYNDGLKRAQAEIEADRQMAMEQSQQLIEEARRTKVSILDSAETDILRLVMAIARKVIVAELRTNPQAIVDIVRQAISYLDNPGNIRVYVNPADLQTLMDAIEHEGLSEIGSRDLGMEIRADKRIGNGGCIIESNMGSVDAQLEGRIHKVEEAIMEMSYE